jgi:hypothetical protein
VPNVAMDGVQAIQLTDTPVGHSWLQIAEADEPSWLNWTSPSLVDPEKRATRMLEPCTLRIVRAQKIERRKVEEGYAVTVDSFTKETECYGTVSVAKLSEARYSPGMSRRSRSMYFVSHVVFVPDGGTPKLGSLGIYPEQGRYKVKVTTYRGSDKNFVVVSAPVGFTVAAR